MDDGRKYQRCSVQWRSAISVIGNSGTQTLQCKTNDISAGGVSVICPLNIFPGSELTVYLLLDPGSQTNPQVVFEAQGKVMNTVFSSKQGGFRLGIEFTKIAGDGKRLLKEHLPKDLAKPERRVTGAAAAPAAAAAAVAEAPSVAAVPAAAPAEELAPAADAAPGDDAPPATNEAQPEGETPSAS